MKANNEDIWTWLEIPWAGDSTEKHKFIYSAEILSQPQEMELNRKWVLWQ